MKSEIQPIGKTYAQIIKFGRLLENHHKANQFTDEHPDVIIHFVDSVDRQLLWTSTDHFFTVFPPIKKYDDDGTWDYHSTMEMRKESFGTHFGKNDFKQILMTRCYENKFLHLVGVSFMWAISRVHERESGRNMLLDFMNKKS